MTTRSPDAAGDAGLNRSAKIGGANVAVEVSLWEEFAADEIHSRLSVAAARTVVLACADNDLRRCLAQRLMEAHWQVREAYGGAAALLLLEQEPTAALLLDGWLPDLEVREFAAHVRLLYPGIELLYLDGGGESGDESVLGGRSSLRNELLQAIREAHREGLRKLPEIRSSALNLVGEESQRRDPQSYRVLPDGTVTDGSLSPNVVGIRLGGIPVRSAADRDAAFINSNWNALLPDLVGSSPVMREMALLVRMVAPRSTPILIEGETGTGKEVVARAIHRLSARAEKPFVVLNCAAIPETLLEAELFGHTRGAFTGAVQSRMGRIEAADGGTLLLDEIGEMPVAMQAKMLRFIESGELQRVGNNEMTRVDVRLIAATHQPLEERSAEGTFRLDLYHRLAVFPIDVPPLRDRMEDIVELSEFFLEQLGRQSPRKRLSMAAAERLQEHLWPGNVRELMHVLERAVILSGTSPEISDIDIRYRRNPRV
jgi:DNA-binding NtrC family response regulator